MNDSLTTIFDKFFESTTDNFIRSIKAVSNFPPYNVIKTSDNKYIIELSVAGFDKEELSIELSNDNIIIKGSKRANEKVSKDNYLWQGLAARDFARAFMIQDLEIKSADLVNGILRLQLDYLASNNKKTIPINTTESKV